MSRDELKCHQSIKNNISRQEKTLDLLKIGNQTPFHNVPTLSFELCLQRAVVHHSLGESDEAVEALSFDRMRSAHHSSLGDGLVLHESRLHLRCTQQVTCRETRRKEGGQRILGCKSSQIIMKRINFTKKTRGVSVFTAQHEEALRSSFIFKT